MFRKNFWTLHDFSNDTPPVAGFDQSKEPINPYILGCV